MILEFCVVCSRFTGSLEDAWREYARRSLLRTGAVVRPLRVAAETARAASRAAGDLDDDGDRSTASFVRSFVE
jgi:hypothetical protein